MAKSLEMVAFVRKTSGFEMYVMDETILLQDHVPKRGPWSSRGQKVLQVYCGDHWRWVIYSTMLDSHQYFLQGKKFNGSTFLKFVKRLLERRYKVALIMDATS